MIKQSSFWALLGSGLVASVGIAGCSSDSDSNTPVGGAGASGNAGASGQSGQSGGAGASGASGASGAGAAGAAGASGAAGAGGVTGKSRVRFAHMGTNLPAKLRVCATEAGATVAKEVTAALASGLGYPQVSAYIDVPEGSYAMKVVDANGNCSAVAVAAADAVSVPNGATYTIVISGDAMSSVVAKQPNLRMLTDVTLPAGATHLRLVHASATATDVDIGAYVGTAFAKVFANASYGANGGLVASNADPVTPIDANGYATVALSVDTSIVFEVRAAATGAVYAALSSAVALPVGTLATAFAHGTYLVDANGVESGLSVLACLDGKEANGLTTCAAFTQATTAPTRPALRVAHVSPDASVATVDVCVKPSSYPTWLPDASQLLRGGIDYKSVSTTLPAKRLPSDTYDWKVMAHASPVDCSKPTLDPGLAMDQLAIDGSTRTTIALLGTAATGANHFAMKAFPNTDTTMEAANASVRFIHAAAGVTGVDVGPLGGPFAWTAIAYGTAGAYKAALFSGGDRLAINYQLTADYDLATAALTATQSTVKGDVYTAWAIGDATVGTANTAPPALLLCHETPASTGSTLACAELPVAKP